MLQCVPFEVQEYFALAPPELPGAWSQYTLSMGGAGAGASMHMHEAVSFFYSLYRRAHCPQQAVSYFPFGISAVPGDQLCHLWHPQVVCVSTYAFHVHQPANVSVGSGRLSTLARRRTPIGIFAGESQAACALYLKNSTRDARGGAER